jgi:hypothetical protein
MFESHKVLLPVPARMSTRFIILTLRATRYGVRSLRTLHRGDQPRLWEILLARSRALRSHKGENGSAWNDTKLSSKQSNFESPG